MGGGFGKLIGTFWATGSELVKVLAILEKNELKALAISFLSVTIQLLTVICVGKDSNAFGNRSFRFFHNVLLLNLFSSITFSKNSLLVLISRLTI